MRSLLIYRNSIDESQMALVEVLGNGEYEIIMSGDWYHDKISEKIEGFFKALDYFNVQYNRIDDSTLTPEDDLYWDLGFIDDCD